MVKITVREEHPGDVTPIAQLLLQTYQDIAYSNHREHLMVERLRASSAYIPQLALVAESGGALAGYLMMTRITIRGPAGDSAALSLAPLAVLPTFQRQGVGNALLAAAHARARALGFTAVIVVGISGYYEGFGYRPLDDFAISLPFQVAPEHRLALALSADAMAHVHGVVEYAPEWMEG